MGAAWVVDKRPRLTGLPPPPLRASLRLLTAARPPRTNTLRAIILALAFSSPSLPFGVLAGGTAIRVAFPLVPPPQGYLFGRESR